ncbi:MAG: type IV-A pilus assembly ATPase PilB [Methylococcales bacterium]|nr:MAG: type IV-A pilus assembly ATPase PilB [Methylococcales bacterium]
MANSSENIPLSDFIHYLIQDGLLTENEIEIHRTQAQRKHTPLLSYLVINNFIDSHQVAIKASKEYNLPFFDLEAIEFQSLPIQLLNEKLIRKHHILPLIKRGDTLFIAISDPTNFQALDDIKFQSQLHAEAILVDEKKLLNTIEKLLEAADTSMSDLLDGELQHLDINSNNIDDEDFFKTEGNSEIDDAPVVRFVNKILLDAIKKGASDIHMEPYEKYFRIRYRSDGILYQVASPPSNIATRIVSRIKVMAKMDIAERRVPQDGRIKMTLSQNRAIDFRVNSCPTLFGEKIVLRILDPSSAQIGIEKLGFEPEQEKLFLRAINKPYGMVLVTGPTGSGKTVTLYTGLNILNSVERNISTAEDPVEITVEGINQVNMNIKAGLTFANALRAFLRQDPDVIMVGEIRDLETAEIAVKAAQTGHLVLSTLHTNDAPQTLNRLMQMGIEPFNIVSAVILIIAQRLARRLCEHCKTPANLPEATLIATGFKIEELSSLKIYSPVGCERCTNGYKGRIGIYQMMTLSDPMRALILEGGNAMQLAQLAKSEGINDLRSSGLNKIRMGITSLEEIDRITKD